MNTRENGRTPRRHYADPTAETAIAKVMREERRKKKLADQKIRQMEGRNKALRARRRESRVTDGNHVEGGSHEGK